MSTPEWHAFQDAGGTAAALTRVRPQIRESWSRSLARGIDPEGLGIPSDEVDLDTEFVRVGSRVLLGMADVLADSQASLALTDASGTIAWRWEPDRALGRLFDATEIHVGSRMSETLAGTNGIAVALHDRRPVTVVGTEHYKQPWHGWACAAAPVVHPTRGQLAGVVNIACRAQDANRLMGVVLRSLVHGVRGGLLDAASAPERRLMDAHARHAAVTDAPVVSLDARHLIAGDTAAGLGLDRAALWSLILQSPPAARGELPVHPDHVGHAHPVTEGRPADGWVVVLRPRVRPSPDGGLGPLQAAERRVIAESLQRHAGNRSEVAAHLGISRGTLYERLRRYGL